LNTSAETADRLQSLEERLSVVEASARDAQDRLDVQNLVAACAYLIDAEAYDKRAELFSADGVFELIPQETFPTQPDWPETSASDVISIPAGDEEEEHLKKMRAANKRGLTHFPSIVHVTVDGDRALAMQHIAVFERDPTAEPLEVPPHGIIRGFRALLVGVNHFDCERAPVGWRIVRRSLRVNTGSDARRVLAEWAAGV
jgi:hypothetical protein